MAFGSEWWCGGLRSGDGMQARLLLCGGGWVDGLEGEDLVGLDGDGD